MKKGSKDIILPYILILPTFLLFGIFFILPVLYSMFLSLNKWNGFSSHMSFIGFGNYIRLFSDPMFKNALINTIYYVFVTVPVSILLSLFLSMLTSEKKKAYSFIRAAYFIPYVVSMVAVSVVWAWIYNSRPYGLLNFLLGIIGISPLHWLSSIRLAMVSMIIIGIWKTIGYNMIIFSAGLKSIPDSIYEAALIDGTGSWSKFRYITLPLLMPTIFFITITSTIAAFFKVFDQINVMTQGGPVDSTEVLVTYLYKVGFKQYEVGYASAIAFVLFIIVIVITLFQKLLIERKIDY